jgi:ribonuclease T1
MRSMLANLFLVVIASFLAASPALARNDGESAAAITEIAFAALPREAQQTLQIIRRGGPLPYERDGVVFGNYERRLPPRGRGYYHEYTVPTPGAKNRGARRIISGGAGEYYYSDDHYGSFKRIRE